jgi:hypothetical protein
VTRTERLIAMGITALISSLLAACSSTAAKEPADPPAPAGAAPAADFQATVTADAGAIRISYTFTNKSNADLLVLNKVLSDPNAVYITGRPGSQVQLAKRAFPMPETDRMSWAQAAQVSGSVVAPGASVSEQLVIARPLKRFYPYGNDFGYGEIKLPDPVKELVFCLGVVRSADVNGKTTVPHLSSTTGVQHLFCSAPAAL